VSRHFEMAVRELRAAEGALLEAAREMAAAGAACTKVMEAVDLDYAELDSLQGCVSMAQALGRLGQHVGGHIAQIEQGRGPRGLIR
jgi:hypothetical protein